MTKVVANALFADEAAAVVAINAAAAHCRVAHGTCLTGGTMMCGRLSALAWRFNSARSLSMRV